LILRLRSISLGLELILFIKKALRGLNGLVSNRNKVILQCNYTYRQATIHISISNNLYDIKQASSAFVPARIVHLRGCYKQRGPAREKMAAFPLTFNQEIPINIIIMHLEIIFLINYLH